MMMSGSMTKGEILLLVCSVFTQQHGADTEDTKDLAFKLEMQDRHIQNLEAQLYNLQSQLHQQAEIIAAQGARVDGLESENKRQQNSYVSFTASASRIREYNEGDHVLFDYVLRNYGNSYYSENSTFICSHNAYYLFTVTVRTDAGYQMRGKIQLDDTPLVSAYANDLDAGTNLVVTYCGEGHSVWVMCPTDGQDFDIFKDMTSQRVNRVTSSDSIPYAGDISRGVANLTLKHYKPWADVFSEKNLNRMAREIQVNDFTSLGSELGFSEAEVQCFREDCHRDHRQAVFKMLLAARNKSALYGKAEQIGELYQTLEMTGLVNMANKYICAEGAQTPQQPTASATPVRSHVSVSNGVHTGVNMNQQLPLENPNIPQGSEELPVYSMLSNKLGLAVLINVTHPAGFPPRHGAERDVRLMADLFGEKFMFDLETHQDLSAKDIERTLENVSKREDIGLFNCLVVVLMSHGQGGHIYGADGYTVQLRYLYDLFLENRCTALIGKPKIFFVQTCRGDDPGYIDPGCTMSDSGPPDIKSITANMLVAYAAAEGYKSHRDGEQGSWFIRTIHEVFMKYGRKEDIQDLLTRVTAQVTDITPKFSATNPAQRMYRQCPEVISRLTKKFFFVQK